VKKHFEKKLSLVKNKIGFEKGGKKKKKLLSSFTILTVFFPHV